MSNDWTDILEPGETILWQGAPDGRNRWSDLASVGTAFGLFFTLFSLSWMGFAAFSMPGALGFLFVLFGMPFLLVGLYLCGGRIIFEARDRRRTHYTLTDRAAYIARDRFGKRSLDRYEITVDMPLGLEDGDIGTVYFAEKTVRHATHNATGDIHQADTAVTTSTVRIGFEQIETPRKVFALLRDAAAYRADTSGRAAQQ
jgi:hypothetical protein